MFMLKDEAGGMKPLSNLKKLFLLCILFSMMLTGCINKDSSDETESINQINHVSVLPDWQDGGYHDYEVTTQLLKEFNTQYPYLVTLFSIGKSTLGRDIWCIKITNENNTDRKLSCLIDGKPIIVRCIPDIVKDCVCDII